MIRRALVADLRIVRPVLLIGTLCVVALVSALSSYTAQDVSGLQLQAARASVDDALWKTAECGRDTPACQQAARRDDENFLRQQRAVAAEIGRLQTLSGAIRHGLQIAATGFGLLAVALIAAQLTAGERARGTLEIAQRADPRLLLRRIVATVGVSVLVVLSTIAGAGVAALVGRGATPLPHGDTSLAHPTFGVLLVLIVWSAVAACIGWAARKPLAAVLSISLVLIATMASTVGGPWSPGAAVMSLVGRTNRFEFEIGYVWLWPPIDFAENGTPDSSISTWGAVASAIVLIGIAAVGLVACARSERGSVR